MRLKSMQGWPRSMHQERSILDPPRQVDSDRSHVANQLLRRLLEREVQAPLAAGARRVSEMGGETRLACSCRAAHQHAAAAIIAVATEHRVELAHAARNSLTARPVVHPERRDWQH